MKLDYLPAKYFYKSIKMPSRTFFDIALKLNINHIEVFNQGRLYSVKDWNKKVKDKYKLNINPEEKNA